MIIKKSTEFIPQVRDPAYATAMIAATARHYEDITPAIIDAMLQDELARSLHIVLDFEREMIEITKAIAAATATGKSKL